jgi:hypothetical protein
MNSDKKAAPVKRGLFTIFSSPNGVIAKLAARLSPQNPPVNIPLSSAVPVL